MLFGNVTGCNRHTIINHNACAIYKLRLVRGEIEHRIGDVVRLADLAERDLAAELREGFFLAEHFLGAVQDRRVDEDRVHRVAADLAAGRLGAMQGDGL